MAAIKTKMIYIVRIKGTGGVKGKESLTEITEVAYKNLKEEQDERDRVVSESGPDYHHPVTLDDFKVFMSKDEIPSDVLDIEPNAQDTDQVTDLLDENAALKAELAKLRGDVPSMSKKVGKGRNQAMNLDEMENPGIE